MRAVEKLIGKSDTRPVRRIVVFIALACCLFSAPSSAQDEITFFKLKDVSGDLRVRYMLDKWDDGANRPEARVSASTWVEELEIRTQSYVYHPGFLSIDVGGGPVLVQHDYASGLGDRDEGQTLFNFHANLDFLSLKPYPFSVYYRQNHPEVPTASSGRILSKDEEYGIHGLFRKILEPAGIVWNAGRSKSEGQGFGTIIDETVDRASVRTAFQLGDSNDVRIDHNWTDRTSKSGNPGLPIQTSQITTSRTHVDIGSTFEGQRPARLRQSFNWIDQQTNQRLSANDELFSYRGNVKWETSDKSLVHSNLTYRESDRTGARTENSDIVAGFNYSFSDALVASIQSTWMTDKAPGFHRDMSIAFASATYSAKLPFGSFGVTTRLGLDRVDQEAVADEVRVFDEPHVLIGTSPVALDNEFVLPSSIVVTNETKSQVFVGGLDYRVVTIGATTTIERIITGNIGDGETVLAFYAVGSGGTVTYDTRKEGLSVNLGLGRTASLYVNYRNSRNDLRSGMPTRPINDERHIEAGGRVSYSLAAGWTIDGDYRYVDQSETISPFVGHFVGINAQTDWFSIGTLRVGMNRSSVDYEFSQEDVEQVSYTLGLAARVLSRGQLSYNAEYLDNDGGTVERSDWRHSLVFNWRYRRLLFSLRADYSDIEQGISERETTRVVAELRRSF